MSHKATELVRQYAKARGVARFVLWVLADHCNGKRGDLSCWPSLNMIADNTKLGRKSICRILTHLEANGDIWRDRSTGGRNKRTKYFITVSEKQCHGNTVKECHAATVAKIETVSLEDKNSVAGTHALNRKGTEIRERVLRTEPDKLTPSSRPPNQRCGVDKQLLSDPPNHPAHPKDLKLFRPTDLHVRPFITWYAIEFQRRFGTPYVITWAKEGKLIKNLPAAFDLNRLKALAIQFFETDDLWVREKGGFTIGVFVNQINRWASTGTIANGKAESVKDIGNGMVDVDGLKMTREQYEERRARRARA